MTRKEFRDDVLRRVGIQNPTTAPLYVLQDATTEINRAFQTIWLAPGQAFFRRQSADLTLTPGVSRYELGSTFQHFLGEVRLSSGSDLRPVSQRGDIENYCRRFLGQMTESAGTPAAYWIERLGLNETDSAGVWLWLAPTPNIGFTLSYHFSTEAPKFTNCDLVSDEDMASPHGYVESLALPLARFYVTRSSWFKDASLREVLKSDASDALAAYGLASPWAEEPEPDPRGFNGPRAGKP